jgi:hypothetical protein
MRSADPLKLPNSLEDNCKVVRRSIMDECTDPAHASPIGLSEGDNADRIKCNTYPDE